MMFDTLILVPYALLLLRFIIAVIFFSSGKSHVQQPVERGKSIGISPEVTKTLGIMEIVGAISIALGIFTQIGSLILMIVMVGAIQKKVFVWKTKFYEVKSYGWHYDLLLLLGLLVIFTTDGGYLSLT